MKVRYKGTKQLFYVVGETPISYELECTQETRARGPVRNLTIKKHELKTLFERVD